MISASIFNSWDCVNQRSTFCGRNRRPEIEPRETRTPISSVNFINSLNVILSQDSQYTLLISRLYFILFFFFRVLQTVETCIRGSILLVLETSKKKKNKKIRNASKLFAAPLTSGAFYHIRQYGIRPVGYLGANKLLTNPGLSEL